MMRDIDEATKADALLTEHYFYEKPWRPHTGFSKCAPECRQAVSSRQWDSTEDIADDACTRMKMEAVEFCINAVTSECRQAIGIEMKNREAGAQVWRSPSPLSYPEAVAMIMPLMRKKDLL